MYFLVQSVSGSFSPDSRGIALARWGTNCSYITLKYLCYVHWVITRLHVCWQNSGFLIVCFLTDSPGYSTQHLHIVPHVMLFKVKHIQWPSYMPFVKLSLFLPVWQGSMKEHTLLSLFSWSLMTNLSSAWRRQKDVGCKCGKAGCKYKHKSNKSRI